VLPLRTTFCEQKFSADHNDAVIHVYDAAGNLIDTHEHKGESKEW